MLEKSKSFFIHLFKTHKIFYQISIDINQIEYIHVGYACIIRGPFGTTGYDIMFHVHTYDGSILSFKSLVTMDRDLYNQAVDYMKEIGINFKDEYHLLDELKNNVPISYYIERLENDKNNL